MLLSISHLSKSYGATHVFEDVTFLLNRGDRVGLVGANGVGKSTLLKLINREIDADDGEVVVSPDMRVGYVPQVIAIDQSKTLNDLIHDVLSHIHKIEERMRALERQMSDQEPGIEAVLDEYGRLTEEFERIGGYEVDHKMALVLGGLGVDHIPRARVLSTLSGGEKARTVLALTLLEAPDLLLLDEPTNHLDFERLEWLEDYLRSCRGAILLVSHDRAMLNRVVDSIIEIDEYSKASRQYVGNYDRYALAKVAERREWEEEYERQQEEIKEIKSSIRTKAYAVGHGRSAPDPDKTAHKFRGARVQQTVSRNIRNAEERLCRIEEDPVPKPPKPLNINPDFDPQELQGKKPVALSHVTKSFGGKLVLDDVSFEVQATDRIVITGENGAGKSTLLKVIVGEEAADSGTVSLAPTAKVGYLDQEQTSLPGDMNVYEVFRRDLIGQDNELKNEFVRYGLFKHEDLSKRVEQLSVGQRRKLQVARLMATRQRASARRAHEPHQFRRAGGVRESAARFSGAGHRRFS